MINTVEKLYDNLTNEFICYKVTFNDGIISSVPHNEANRHYQEILEWVAAGNTITDNGGGE
jgi:hypothetical protein